MCFPPHARLSCDPNPSRYTSLTEEQTHPGHSIPTELKRHRCCSTVTGVLRLDHPPLPSVCLNSCWLQSGQELDTDGSRAPPVCVDTTTRCYSCSLFTDDGNSVTRLGQEYNDQALTDPDLTAHLVVCHIARQSSAAVALGFSSHWWSRECVICTPQSPLHASYAWGYACCIPHCRTSRLETNCYASRDSNESFCVL